MGRSVTCGGMSSMSPCRGLVASRFLQPTRAVENHSKIAQAISKREGLVADRRKCEKCPSLLDFLHVGAALTLPK